MKITNTFQLLLKKSNWRQRLGILFSFLLVTVLFQNCWQLKMTAIPKASVSTTTSGSVSTGGGSTTTTAGLPSAPAATTGGGQGYDGFTYNLLLQGGVCADGSPVNVQIVVENSDAVLTRNNCAAIPAAAQTVVTVQFNPQNPDTITYDGMTLATTTGTGVWSSMSLTEDGPGTTSVCYESSSIVGASGGPTADPTDGVSCDPAGSPGTITNGPPLTLAVFDLSAAVYAISSGSPAGETCVVLSSGSIVTFRCVAQ